MIGRIAACGIVWAMLSATQAAATEDPLQYYPPAARAAGIEGSATISCTVNAGGTLDACSVVSESPPDVGFGDAALKMAKLFKMRPSTKDGAPASGGTVRIPIRFKLPPAVAPQSTTAPPSP